MLPATICRHFQEIAERYIVVLKTMFTDTRNKGNIDAPRSVISETVDRYRVAVEKKSNRNSFHPHLPLLSAR